ncbi:ABC transporter ATP-binding protein [Natrinema gelatinilyticum]|uniref:ABC transporter ATP-binding protein n=1 Tax=Natrinema gelatinilyticum TaxID=2961571 RepID=UPI0020C2B1BD|nr:ABC transporter ATP-binding protein [Natrinema gelatinilyticum]
MTVKVENLTKKYISADEEVVAVDDVSFEVTEGDLFTLLGPSGCGKTTTLRCLAGLEIINGGRIEIDSDVVATPDQSVQPEHRDIGLVFQSYALWPHMTARENILYALKGRDWPKEDRENRIQESLELVGLPDVGDRYPSELSGGQQQRISFARAVSYQPSVLLMDEPLSNLDFKQRRRMRRLLLEMLDEVGITTIYVTHDQEEAFEISDETLVLTDGKEAQQAPPEELYEKPTSPFVANFLGEANLYSATPLEVNESEQTVVCEIAEGDTRLEMKCTYGDEEVLENPVVVIRPEDVKSKVRADGGTSNNGVITQETQEANQWEGEISRQLYRGSFTQNIVDVGDITIKMKTDKPILGEDETVTVSVDPEDASLVLGHR